MTMTMGSGSARVWFTPAELAALRLPGLSTAKRKINELAQSQRWALRTDRQGAPLARPRQGRGGGLEYHVAVLPPQATTALTQMGLIGQVRDVAPGEPVNDVAVPTTKGQLWSWFDQQSDAVKAEAHARLAMLDALEALEAAGLTRSAAVATVAAQHGTAGSTLWGYLTLVAGAQRGDRLPLLAPQRKGGGKAAEVDAAAWQFLVSDYLRPEKPTFSSCYQRCLTEFCAPRGLTLPHQKTLQRKLEREVDGRVIIARREGADALRATIPHQQRSVADMHALEVVNIDGHRWDVFVRWPDGAIARPMMVAIQDVYSRKILSWRIDETESAVLTRLAFADLFADYGIPKGCLMDNGRAFASKMITGGSTSRFRFKIKAEEPTGLLTALGVRVHWALPYRGSSKPIERAFRDLCDTVAKHPAFAGAYTGNRPDAKPENYGAKAIDLETFRRVVQLGIDAHNARIGRRTEACVGRLSFDQAFNASYAVAPIGKATPEQLRMALLASKIVSTDRKNGSVGAYGNIWWSPAMSALAGQKVILRYDPDKLDADVHVYGLDGRYLASAQLQGRTAFLDAAAAGKRARQEAELKKATRQAIKLQQLLTAEELAAMMPDLPDDEDETPAPKVVRPVRHRGMTAAALKPVEQVAEPAALPTPQPALETPTIADRRLNAIARLVVVK